MIGHLATGSAGFSAGGSGLSYASGAGDTRRFHGFFVNWLLAWAMVLVSPCIAWGQQDTQATHATVRLDGRALFRVAESDDIPARERARQIEQRLAAALENPRSRATAEVTATDPEQHLISVGEGQ